MSVNENEKLDLILNKLVSLDHKVDSLDHKVDSLEQRVTILENNMKDVKSDLKRLHHNDISILDEIERVHTILEKHKSDQAMHTA